MRSRSGAVDDMSAPARAVSGSEETLLDAAPPRGAYRNAAAAAASTSTSSGHKSGVKSNAASRARAALRVGGATVAAAVVYACVKATRYVAENGWPDASVLSPREVHRVIDDFGTLGIAIYVFGFALAELLHLPAMVFVTAGILKWGKFIGWLLSLVIAPLSCGFAFVVVRRVGGQALTNVRWTFVKKMLMRLDRRPVATVAILRTFLFLSPSLNYALALSSISLKHFMVGNFLGLLGPLTLACLAIDKLISYYGWSKGDAFTN